MKSQLTLLLIFALSVQTNAADLSPLTQDLNGTTITYRYTSGRSYNVKFEKQGISYRYLTGSKPKKWWGPFPYKAYKVTQYNYLAAWHEKNYGDYVTLLINVKTKLLYGSAILSGKETHFHGAKISQITQQ